MRVSFAILLVLPFLCIGQSYFSVNKDFKLPVGYFTVVSIVQDSAVFSGLPNSVLHVGDVFNFQDENLIIESNKIKVRYSFFYNDVGNKINVCRDDYCMFFEIIANDNDNVVLNSRHYFTYQFRKSDVNDPNLILNGIKITLKRVR